MELQERKYLINDNSILLKEYKDVNKANNNLEYEMQNSLGSNAFQSMSKFPQNQENKNNTFTNSNMNYPVQNFENSANPMNASNGNGFQSFPNKFDSRARYKARVVRQVSDKYHYLVNLMQQI